MTTQVIRIPLVDPLMTLEKRIINECDVRHAAGYRLQGCFVSADNLALIFQKV